METGEKPTLGYILKGYPRISETFISNEILRLEQLGFSLILFPMRKPRENFCHRSVKEIKAPVHYLPTHLFRDFHRLIGPNLLLAIYTPKRYVAAVTLALKRFARTKKGATFKHLFQAGYMVYHHLRHQSSVDHLHGHFAHSPTSVTMFASKLSGIPYSFTAHAKDIYTSDQEQLREKINQAEFVATCTNYNSSYLNNIANSTTPIYCVYHGIDTSLCHSTGANKKCVPPYSLLTVARLTEKKGLPTLLRALALLQQRNIDFHHTLIGDGDDRVEILQLIKDLGLQERCQWLGSLTHDQVLNHFRRSDLFVLGCRIAANGDRDGIPNVLVESLAMGVPAVSTDVSAIPEIIRNNETGLITPPDDHIQLADSIIELLTNTELRQRVIKKGQSHVRTHFDNIKLSKDLAKIFLTHSSGKQLNKQEKGGIHREG